MSSYKEKLKDPRWQKKRLEILNRDEWSCQRCGDIKNCLHVHHLYYLNGKSPWDYDDSALVTYCESCHYKESRESYEVAEDFIHRMRKCGFSNDGLKALGDFFEDIVFQDIISLLDEPSKLGVKGQTKKGFLVGMCHVLGLDLEMVAAALIVEWTKGKHEEPAF